MKKYWPDKTTFFTKIIAFVMLFLFALSLLVGTAQALSPEQKKLYQKNILYYDLGCSEVSKENEIKFGKSGDVEKFLKALAYQESGGDPNQPGSAGGARGKYQYIDSTWKSSAEAYYAPALKYQQAHTAPESVQDAVAFLEYSKKFDELGDDLFELAVSHFYPAANSDSSLLDVVPPANVITPRQYANKLINSIKQGGEWEKIPLKYSEAPDFEKYANKLGLDPASDKENVASKRKKAYVIGDSITEGAASKIKAELRKKDIEATVDASLSRSIQKPGTTGNKSSGLEALRNNKDKISKSDALIIALGTNLDDNFANSMEKMVSEAQEYNENIYWVNVFSNVSHRSSVNRSIDEVASDKNIDVIDTTGQNIELSRDGINPTFAGQKKFAKVIADSLELDSGALPQENKQAGNLCECQNGTSQLRGSDAEAKIFNFYVDNGYSPEQAAGFVGNYFQESGLNPTIVNSLGAIGIAQWLDRRPALEAFANQKGKPPTDLDVQLEFSLFELKGSESAANSAIKAVDGSGPDAVKEVTVVIRVSYERPGESEANDPNRIAKALEVYEKYSGGTSGSGSSPSSESGCEGKANSEGGPFNGSPQEAAKYLLSKKSIQISDGRELIQAVADGQNSPVSDDLILLLAGLAQNHDYGISSLYRPGDSGNHGKGLAVDINPYIDGVTISYSSNDPKVQAFIDDGAKILGNGCENGVPNQRYVDETLKNGSKCEVFVDVGTGPHVHLSVEP